MESQASKSSLIKMAQCTKHALWTKMHICTSMRQELGCARACVRACFYLWLSSSKYLLLSDMFISSALILLLSLMNTDSFWLEPCTWLPFP